LGKEDRFNRTVPGITLYVTGRTRKHEGPRETGGPNKKLGERTHQKKEDTREKAAPKKRQSKS